MCFVWVKVGPKWGQIIFLVKGQVAYCFSFSFSFLKGRVRKRTPFMTIAHTDLQWLNGTWHWWCGARIIVMVFSSEIFLKPMQIFDTKLLFLLTKTLIKEPVWLFFRSLLHTIFFNSPDYVCCGLRALIPNLPQLSHSFSVDITSQLRKVGPFMDVSTWRLNSSRTHISIIVLYISSVVPHPEIVKNFGNFPGKNMCLFSIHCHLGAADKNQGMVTWPISSLWFSLIPIGCI